MCSRIESDYEQIMYFYTLLCILCTLYFILLCTGKKFKPNDVILTTALGGRGTDFAVNDEVHASGGLFVLLSHLAPNR